ncbi:hypothetical protein GQX73_g2112 [Xylaria multiplex]|uniref:CENP-V/GFA domain-containing protein n=1 Tax=Xylaria multiplex TaxID=323545 RepID=A0A7C8J1A8_9PEZI|nr:hypothetical protein GQX73_g2112 [Xylaria multiplex]
MASEEQQQQQQPKSATYEAGCHCGYIKFTFTLSPGLDEYQVMRYPDAKDVVWHNNSRERCVNYQFNTKTRDHMSCPKCGASLGIDFREVFKPHRFGFSARTIYGIELDKLIYKEGDGLTRLKPAGDLSGHYWDEEKQEMK